MVDKFENCYSDFRKIYKELAYILNCSLIYDKILDIDYRIVRRKYV